MRVLSLFSGIGAFEKALDRLERSYELVGFSEIDKYAVKSYCAIHGVDESMNLGDITKIDENALPKNIDLITYGFPCQDISLAGKQKGLFNEDGTQTRSGLFFEALRIIEAAQPRVAIAENVKNLTSKKFSEQFKIVLDSLEAAGYNNYWQVLNAKDYGIPQNRERVFIVSIRKDIDGGTFEFPEGFPLQLRLKDMLDDDVDEKFYIDSTKLNQFVSNNPHIDTSKAVLGTCHERNDLSFATRDRVYNAEMESPTLTATMFKDPPKILQIGQMYGTDKEPNPQAGRVYSADGISPTMDTCNGGNRMPKVLVREATKKGYAEAYEGDSINLEQPNSKTRRGRVGKQVSQTITTSPQQAVAVAMRGRYNADGQIEQNVEVSDREYANALTTVQKDSLVAEPQIIEDFYKSRDERVYEEYSPSLRADRTGLKVKTMLRIRKLTPKECFRLMDFDDTDFEKAEAVNSNTQLYKQAGNSIVVAVPYYIIEALFKANIFIKKENEMELKVKEVDFPKLIEFNFEELKQEITEKADLYKNMVYTDETIKDAKADKAKLNKFITALEDKRKDVKKQCLAPYEAFEKQMKELVAIVDEPVKLIDSQVKAYEDKQKAEKLEQIKEYWEGTEHPEWLQCKAIFDQRWLNVTFSMKKVQEAIDERLAQIASDVKTLESLPEFSFEAVEVYKQTIDLNRAIAEGQRLADIQKRKAEAEAARQAEEEKKAAEAEVVQAVTPPIEETTEAEPAKQWIGFEALLSVAEAKELRAFFNQKNIEFRMILK